MAPFLAIRSHTPEDVAWFLRSQKNHASRSSNNSGGPELASAAALDLLPEEVRFFIGLEENRRLAEHDAQLLIERHPKDRRSI